MNAAAPDSEAFVARFSRGQLLLPILGSAGFVVLGLNMTGTLDWLEFIRANDSEGLIIGSLCVSFFGACGLAMLWFLVVAGTAIRIDSEGIFDRGGFVDKVPWSKIKKIAGWQATITVHGMAKAQSPDMILYKVDRSFKSRKTLLGRIRGFRVNSCSLTLTGTDATVEELNAAIERFAPPHLLEDMEQIEAKAQLSS